MPVRGQICQIWQAQLRGAEVTALAAEEKLLRASLADVQAEVWLALIFTREVLQRVIMNP